MVIESWEWDQQCLDVLNSYVSVNTQMWLIRMERLPCPVREKMDQIHHLLACSYTGSLLSTMPVVPHRVYAKHKNDILQESDKWYWKWAHNKFTPIVWWCYSSYIRKEGRFDVHMISHKYQKVYWRKRYCIKVYVDNLVIDSN